MESLKKLSGILLLLLGAAKVLGLVALLLNGAPSPTAWWVSKQVLYAVFLVGMGSWLWIPKSKSIV